MSVCSVCATPYVGGHTCITPTTRSTMRPEKAIREMVVILEALNHAKEARALRWVLGEYGQPESHIAAQGKETPNAG